MGKNYRPSRLGGEIKKIVSEMLINGVKDPRLQDAMISVTDCEVTNDGSFAYIYIHILSFSKDEDVLKEQKENVLSGLNSAKGLFKKEIAKRVMVRRIPELIFKFDEAAEYGQHIDDILSTLPFDEYHAVDPNEEKDEVDDL